MAANISYETLLRLKERLLARLDQVNKKIEKCCQEHHSPATALSRACNRHVDCDIAEQIWKAKHPNTFIGFNFHCHDEECEDCFGT